MVQDLSKKDKKKEKKDEKKEKGDKKEKKEKKDKRALFDDEGKEDEPAKVAPQASQHAAVLPVQAVEEKKKDKKDKKEQKEQKDREKKDKKDKKDKKEKRGGKEEQESGPAGKKAKRSEDIEAADFWKEIEDGIDARQGQLGGGAVPLSIAVGNADVHLAEAEAARLATQAELEEVKRRAAEAEAEVAAARKKAEDLVAAEATAAANAEAEIARLKAAAEAAEAAAAALGPPDETAAAALQAEEEAFEVDLDRPRSLSLTTDELQLLQTEEGRWLERARRMSPSATITLVEGAPGAWEAQVSGDIPGAARRGELSLRCILGALTTSAVEMRVLPEADSENSELLDIPEGAAGAIQPQKLADTWEVIAAFIRQKEPIKPRPHANPDQVELGKMLGLAVGQAVEVRYESEWYHGTAVGFSEDGVVQVEWFGGGRAEMPAVDVRASKTKVPAQAAKQPPTHGLLVLMGELRQRTGAKLQAMAAVDRRVVGHFAERNPPASTNSLFGFDVRLLKLPAGDMGACAKQCSKIAKASEALVEVLGRHALLAGEADERSRAEVLLTRMVPQAGPFGDIQEVPEELLEYTSKVRVPASAVSAVSGPERCLLSRTEDNSGCLVFLLPLGTIVPPRGRNTGVVVLGGGACHSGGTAVNAKYKGQWHAATVLGVSEEPGKVRVQWDYDGSEEDVPAEDLRPSGASEKRRETWLGKPRVFVIIGPERARRSCAMQIMAASEAACPGLWTGCLQEACSEVRDGSSEEEVIVGVEAATHDGTPLELEWLRSPAGQQAVQGASVAAPCRLELIGNAIFCAGYPDQRSLGRTYLHWALLSRHRISGAGGERAGGALSVVDADMREDITISFLSEAQAVWLRQERLWAIEKETETMLLFDNGGGSALAVGQRRLLICGWSEEKRQSARLRVEAIGTSGASSLSSALAAAADKSAEGTRPADAEVGAPDAKKLKADMSDPRAVLKSIPWPATINAWGTLQKKIWAGHPKLASGWIRVWSRSQDSEYYLRLKDMKTTFDINDVLA